MTIFQFVSSLTTGLLIIAGLFILLGIRSTDMTQQLFSKLRQKQKRKRMIQRLAGKKPGTLKRKISEAKWMLDSAGMGEHISTYRWFQLSWDCSD